MSSSETELATQIANELGAAEMLQGQYLDAVPIIARSLTAYSLALTAAVRREDAKIAGLCESWYEGKREEAAKYAGEEILALSKLQEQSALDAYVADKNQKIIALQDEITEIEMMVAEQQSTLDAYRDSVLPQARKQTLQEVMTRWDKDGVESEDIWNWLCDELESTLEGSSDAAKEA